MTYSLITILYNPKSTGPGKSMAMELEKQIRERLPGQKVQLRATKHAGHAEEITYKTAKASRSAAVFSASGDGGYNEVVNGAMRARREGYSITTGVLPAGNANDHYRNLHKEDVIEMLVQGKAYTIDVLKIVGTSQGKHVERYAHSYIGVGLTPKVGQELNKTKLHFFSELWVVARTIFTIEPVRITIGGAIRWYESIVFSNVDEMSKYLKISRPSSVTDGKFEVTVFRKRSKLSLFTVLLKASFSGIVENSRVKKFQFATVDKTLIQADGEIITFDAATEIVVSIEKQALVCIV